MLRAGEVKTIKISYSKIKKIVTNVNSVAAIASAVIAILTNFGYAVPGMVAIVVKYLDKISGLIKDLISGSSSHGLSVKLRSYLRSSTKNGKVYKYTAWKVIGI